MILVPKRDNICYNIPSHHRQTPGAMQTSYARKKSISITLDLEVYDDFDISEIDFNSLLELEGDEHLEVSITGNSDVEVY